MSGIIDPVMICFRDEIIQRRDAIMRDWDAFKNGVSQFHIAEVIERGKTDLPDDYVAWAPGIGVADDYLLRAAGYRAGSHRPEGWCQKSRGSFSKLIYGCCLWVRRCGQFWVIERGGDTALVYRFGSLPIVTGNYQAAMYLAEYCHPPPGKGEFCAQPQGVASNLKWTIFEPDGVRYLN